MIVCLDDERCYCGGLLEDLDLACWYCHMRHINHGNYEGFYGKFK